MPPLTALAVTPSGATRPLAVATLSALWGMRAARRYILTDRTPAGPARLYGQDTWKAAGRPTLPGVFQR